MLLFYSTNSSIKVCLQGTDHGPLDLHTKAGTSTSQHLAEVLKRATMDDKTVILTEVSEAWAQPGSLLDLFIESFHVGDRIEHLLNHTVMMAVDQKAFERCQFLHPHCFRLIVQNITDYSSEKLFMTGDYLKLVWAKVEFNKQVLELGYNIIYTDMDIIWFRNPLQHVSVMSHLTLATDWYNGNPEDNHVNTGFFYVKSCNKTIEFYERWYMAREKFPNKATQPVFDSIKRDLSSDLQVQIRYIDTAYVGGLCQPKMDFSKLCTMHATCRVGLKSKLDELKHIFDEWKKYKQENLS
ncbi:hypothetical protein LUZ60_000498 [Juncus effusus]|nr:hypothetical protein LUZ60_000498 [Juncus effusus]